MREYRQHKNPPIGARDYIPKEPKPSGAMAGGAVAGHEGEGILATLKSEPVESGVRHPVEPLLEAFIQRHRQSAPIWLEKAILAEGRAAERAELLLVLRRMKLDLLVPDWRRHLVAQALKSPDVRLRDAAIQAAESWGDPGTIQVLSGHTEPVSWLSSYLKEVIHDLSGAS